MVPHHGNWRGDLKGEEAVRTQQNTASKGPVSPLGIVLAYEKYHSYAGTDADIRKGYVRHRLYTFQARSHTLAYGEASF